MNLLLISSSTVHGGGYLEHCEGQLRALYEGCREVLFIPYARPGGLSHEAYTERVRAPFEAMGFALRGVHAAADPRAAVDAAEALYVGGGNTFVLLRDLYGAGLVDAIRARVRAGLPYAGSSAGSNVAGRSIGTTNDMPIVYPPTFDALGLVPFNVNPHYLDPDPASTHMGETRETRIREFHGFNAQPVVGLREGAMLRLAGERLWLEGTAPARLFRASYEPEEFAPGRDLSFLLTGG